MRYIPIYLTKGIATTTITKNNNKDSIIKKIKKQETRTWYNEQKEHII